MAISDQVLLQQIQDCLIEPPDGGQSWPSGLWTRDEMVNYANQRQDKLLMDVLLQVTTASLTVNIGDRLIALPTDWLRTVTAVWRGNDGTITELQRSDSFEADHGLSTWQSTNASPQLYMEDDLVGSLQIQIAPGPTVAGTIDLLYCQKGTTLNGNGVAVALPDDFLQALKYGVLAAALSKDGRGKDPARAAYCETRVDLVEMAAALILKGWS